MKHMFEYSHWYARGTRVRSLAVHFLLQLIKRTSLLQPLNYIIYTTATPTCPCRNSHLAASVSRLVAMLFDDSLSSSVYSGALWSVEPEVVVQPMASQRLILPSRRHTTPPRCSSYITDNNGRLRSFFIPPQSQNKP